MDPVQKVVKGVIRVPTSFVNAYLVGDAENWVLVDTGLPGFTNRVRAAAARAFGAHSKPMAIILTHGHFDHSGSARSLAKTWGAPILVHAQERPYVTGESKYPPPDPTVGGIFGFLSRMMPRRGVNLSGYCELLDVSGQIPGRPDWKWLATPGHSPGHVSLFRWADQTVIAGDALATMNMETLSGVVSKKRLLARAGAPFNYDWDATAQSVRALAELNPNVLTAGHGLPMAGPRLALDLHDFAERFPIPRSGRYANRPAKIGDHGIVSLPPKPFDPLLGAVLVLSVAALGAYCATRIRRDPM